MKRKSNIYVTQPKQQNLKQQVDIITRAFNASRYEDVYQSSRSLIKRHPHYSPGWLMLGLYYKVQNRLVEALDCFNKAVELDPSSLGANNNLAIMLRHLNKLDESERIYKNAIAIHPGTAELYANLGSTLRAAGKLLEAADSYETAIKLKPNYFGAYNNLGLTLKDLWRFEAAEECFKQVITINPDCAEAYNNLGTIYNALGQYTNCEKCFRKAVSINPNYALALGNLGGVLQELGRFDEAGACLSRALELDPDNILAFSSNLFGMNANERISPEKSYEAHLRFGQLFESPLKQYWGEYPNDRSADRRLRVGFVSADLRKHAVTSFIQPIFTHLNPDLIEIWVYANQYREDDVTLALKKSAKSWRQVLSLTDDQFAQQIRDDRIDILIDLSGHTAGHRLLTFARKPAPVQATWIGYGNTTGLSAMDYVIIDAHIAPHGLYEKYWTEKFARLPAGYIFKPDDNAPEVNDLPAMVNGYITFGSFNRTGKVTETTIQVWSMILSDIPNSKMLVAGVPDSEATKELCRCFLKFGIGADRLEFHLKTKMYDYFLLHHKVDFILDSWPYSGSTTTCHAMNMGIPVIALSGPSMMHCCSTSWIKHFGLDSSKWVANDIDGYMKLACYWAVHLDELAQIRQSLRAQIHRAPLNSHNVVCRALEFALRAMWSRFCRGEPVEHFEVKFAKSQDLDEKKI